MDNDTPILEVNPFFSQGMRKLKVFRNRVELWEITTSFSNPYKPTKSIPLSEITDVYLKPWFFLWGICSSFLTQRLCGHILFLREMRSSLET